MRTMSVQQLFCLFLFFLVLNSVVCGFYIKRKMAEVKTWVFFLDTKHAKHLMCFVHCDELSTCERDDDDEEYCVIILCVWYDGCNSMMLRRMAAVVIIIVFDNRSARCTAIRPHIFPFCMERERETASAMRHRQGGHNRWHRYMCSAGNCWISDSVPEILTIEDATVKPNIAQIASVSPGIASSPESICGWCTTMLTIAMRIFICGEPRASTTTDWVKVERKLEAQR